MKKICVVTGTRAEYGLLRPIIEKISNDSTLELVLVATGMHFWEEYGCTYQEIVNDGYKINEKIEVELLLDTKEGMAKTTGYTMIAFAEYFSKNKPDLLVVLGDRYEIFACATVAAMLQIPIAHISGGDTTEGAIDEFLRHSITKMSALHFVSNETSKKRVIQLGENPNNVFNVGSTGVENILNLQLLSKDKLEDSLNISLKNDFSIVTFHPVTMENYTSFGQLQELFKALDELSNMIFIFTKANSDADGRIINKMIDDYVSDHKNCFVYTSLGVQRYLSSLKYAKLVIGNSSSGIYEAPSFKIPTINIGDRQKGRLQGNSIINCEPKKEAILNAIKKGLSMNTEGLFNSYEGKNTSIKIVEIIKEYLNENKIEIKKKFNDIEV